MPDVALITGAGSGIGRAIALALAHDGWQVVLVGRRAEPLQETAGLAGGTAPPPIIVPCDVADATAVAKVAEEVLARFGAVGAVVNAAGTNVPRRGLAELSLDDYRRLIDVNLNGAFYVCRAFLPVMRQRRRGTIVNIASDAGLIASAKAGPGYVASKFGLVGLTQSINADERAHGIRATAICPGDVNTPLLDRRPNPPPADARATMLQPEDVAECAMLAIRLPERAVVEQLIVRPR